MGGSVPPGRGHQLCRPPATAASPAPAEPPRPVVPPVGPGTARPSAGALGGQDGPGAAPRRNFGPPRPPSRQLRPHTRTAPASGSRGTPTRRPGGAGWRARGRPTPGHGRGGGGRTGTARKGSGAARGRREGFLRGCWFTLEVLHSDVADVPDELLALEPVPLLPGHGDGGTRGRPLRGRGEVKGGRREPAAPPPPPSPAPTAAAERAGGAAPLRAAPRPAALPSPPASLRLSARPGAAERWRAGRRSGVGVRLCLSPPPPPRAVLRLPPPACSYPQRGSRVASPDSGVGGSAAPALTAPSGAGGSGPRAAESPRPSARGRCPRPVRLPRRPSPHPAPERAVGTLNKYVLLAEAAGGLQTIPSSCPLSLWCVRGREKRRALE